MSEALRVVVVEDEALIRMDVVATLEEAGFEIVGEGADGEEAISLAKEHEPD
ncbi:MAG: response regulator, partial [Aquiluna sp.]